ncbi:ABC transporter permease [Fusibacter sp. A1]|nr:ABC transporter permease [Fusibacter sp. A1]
MKRYSSAPYLVWSALFIIIPLLMILFLAFTKTTEAGYAFSLESVFRLFDPLVMRIGIRSFVMALVATALCLVLGYPVAYMLTKLPARVEKWLVVLLVLPMWMNFLLRTYAIQYLLGPTGLVNQVMMSMDLPTLNLLFNEGAVLFGMVYNYIPFMILPIYTVISKMDNKLIEAAEDLGATGRRVFTHIILPLSLPGVFSGITMTFMPAVSTFVISALLGGGKYDLIGNLIERQFTLSYDWHFGSALSMVLMIIILLLMTVLGRFEGESEGGGLW